MNLGKFPNSLRWKFPTSSPFCELINLRKFLCSVCECESMFACVRVCMCERENVRACVRVCVHVCVYALVC